MKNFLILLIFGFVSMSFANETNNSAVIQEIQTTFQNVKTIETKFEQIVSSSRFIAKKSSGKLLIERPGKMIWNYEVPKGRVFAADGTLITLYDPEDHQALISQQPKEGKLPAGFSFLMGKTGLTEFFTTEILSDEKNLAGNREVKILCKPKTESYEFKTLELTFTWAPKLTLVASKTVDMMGSENQINFQHMKFNTKISSKAFDVELPKGTPIVTNNGL